MKILSLGLATLFSSVSFANDAAVVPEEITTEYAITLIQEPTIVGSIFYGSTIRCKNDDFSSYSAKIVSDSEGDALQIVSTDMMDCLARIIRDFELDLDLYIDHSWDNPEEYYNSLPLSNVVINLQRN
jgi:hypothetical protein